MESRVKELHSDLENTSVSFQGYKILFLSQVYIAESCFGVYKFAGAINIVKRLSLDTVVKFLHRKISAPFTKIKKGSFKYVFVNEVNNKAVVETLEALSKSLSDKNSITIFSDPRIQKGGGNQVNIFDYVSLWALFVWMWESLIFLLRIWSYRKEVSSIAIKYDIPKPLLYLNILDSILMIRIAGYVMANLDTRKIVLMSDVHKFSRIMVLLSKGNGVRSFVVQHGATIGEEGYLPIIADKILVWGEASRNWFLSNGQPADRMEIVGSPRMDSERFVMECKLERESALKVLIVLSDILVETNFLKIIHDIFLRLTTLKVELWIKLHPGGAVDYSFIPSKIFSGTGITFKIFRFEDIKSLLKDSDLVFVTNSTVGMEAIVYGKPIFQYKGAELLNYRMAYEDFNCSFIFSSPEHVLNVILDDTKLYSRVENYRKFVAYYFFELDGKSSERAIDFINNS